MSPANTRTIPPASGCLVGLDIGTTRVKAVAFDTGGAAVATAERPTPWQHTPQGVEMRSADLTDVLRAVVGQACAAVTDAGAAVLGIGVTGMGESGVLATEELRALAPVRAWHDHRADVETVRNTLGHSEFTRNTGMPLDSQPSLPKILQLRRDHPGCLAATRFYSVPEWAVLVLGGRPGSELTLASRTGLLEVATASAWPAAVDLLGLDLLGPPQLAGTPMGRAAAVPGAGSAVLTVAGHDHQSAALAAGAAREGILFDSLGTGEALVRFTGTDIAPDVVGTLVAAGITVGRAVVDDQLCLLAGLRTGMRLEALAAELGAADRHGRRVLADHPRWRAGVVEVVSDAAPALASIDAAVGAHRAVLAAGGWLHDPVVLAAKQAQLPGLVTTQVAEAGAAGAAYLAGVAAGVLPCPSALTGAPWATATPTDVADPAPDPLQESRS